MIRYNLDPFSDLDQHVIETGEFEPHIVAVARRLNPKLIFDVGANVGLLALPFAEIATVHAFEPDSECFKKLQANVALNPELPITCHCVAIQHKCEPIQLSVRRVGGNSGLSSLMRFNCHVKSRESVMGMSVDSYDMAVDLIKIDVEGAESLVLQGAAETIAKHKPAIIWEHSVAIDRMTRSRNTRDAFTFLRCRGYRQWIIQKDATLTPMRRWIPTLNYADILVEVL